MSELLIAMTVVATLSLVLVTSMALLSDTYQMSTAQSKLLQKKIIVSNVLKKHLLQAGSTYPNSQFGEISEPIAMSFDESIGNSEVVVVYDESESSRVKYRFQVIQCPGESNCYGSDADYLQITKWSWTNDAWAAEGDSEVLLENIDAFEVVVENSNGLKTSAFPSLTNLFDGDVALITVDIIMRTPKAVRDKPISEDFELFKGVRRFNDRFIREYIHLTFSPRLSL